MSKTRVLIYMGFYISLEIILTRFLSIQTPILRLSFGFIPIALAAIMFGPILGGVTAMLSDILGMIIFPQGVYFPGFTFSAFLGGAIYGVFLHKRSNKVWRITVTVLIIAVGIDMGLNTLWLSMLTGKAAMVILVPRILKSLIMLPVQIFLIHIVWRYIDDKIKSSS